MAHYHPYALAAQQHHHRCLAAAAAQHQQQQQHHHHQHHLPPLTLPAPSSTSPLHHHHHLSHNLPLRHHHHHHHQQQQQQQQQPQHHQRVYHPHHHQLPLGAPSTQLIPASVIVHSPINTPTTTSGGVAELSPITLPSMMAPSPSPPPRPTTPTTILSLPSVSPAPTNTILSLPPIPTSTTTNAAPPRVTVTGPPTGGTGASFVSMIRPARTGEDNALLTRSTSSPSRLVALDLATPNASQFSIPSPHHQQQLHSATSAQAAAAAAAAVAAATAQAAANSVAMFHEQVRQLHSHSHFRNLEEAHEQLVRDMILTHFGHASSVPTIMHHHFHHHHHHHMPLLDTNEEHDSPLVSSMTMFQAPAPLDLQYETLSQLEPVPRGASTEAIEKLPTSIFSASQVSNSDDEAIITRCNICLDDYCDGDQLKTLAMCKHNFHSDCIIKWLAINKTCPVCRAEVTASSPPPQQQQQQSPAITI